MRQRHSGIRFYRPQQPETKGQRHEKGRTGWLGFGRKLFWYWWLWIAVGIAAKAGDHDGLAIACAIVGFVLYLLAPTEEIPRYGLDSKFSVQSHEFLSSMVGATGVSFIQNNKVTILNNGDEFYPAMLEAIANAKKTITMETYIYWDGDIGHRFAEAIAERCQAGVCVKLLLDSFGSMSIGKEIQNIFKESGCEIAWYNRVWVRTIGRFNHRNHRKSLIVDGRVAFTGGAGIADQWTGNGKDVAHWHDVQIRIEGPGALGLQNGFARNWLETTGELLSGSDYFPPGDSAGTISTQTIFSSPKSGSSAVRIMYDLSIISARKTLYIANPYFIPDDSLVQILVEARKRGVDVKIMVAGIHNDMRISRYASIDLYGLLLQAGIEIYEYNRTMLHQKTMVVDTMWATVGTTNFDPRSFSLDEESNVCVYDRRIAEKLESIFYEDLKHCDQVTLDEWRHRGIKTRVLGEVCVFLKEQI